MAAAASPVRAALAVEDRLLAALAVLRVVVLVNAVALNLYRGVGRFEHPAVGYALLAVMVAWTAGATWAYRDASRRGPLLLGADLGVALALLLATPWVKGPGFDASLPGFWVMAPLLAWAIHHRLPGGLAAGVLLAGTDLLVRDEVTQNDYGNVFLLLVGGPVVGYLAGSLKQMAADRDRAERARAAAEERTRLARVVHDGVLQVLTLVQRRGAELGGEAGDLGRLAGEQEVVLRTLIRAQDAVAEVAEGPPGTADLADALGRLGVRREVDVALPGGTVELPEPVVAELVAVVVACLDNVARHVGERAPAWVLLEDLPDRVVVSVRDEGPGIPAGRLEEARAQGRLGVTESIRGRVADLGGTAELSTGSFGTEWEIAVPRP